MQEHDRPPFLWLLKGLVFLPWHLAAWSTWQCTWGYTFQGERESLRWRLGCAWTMWKGRYLWR